jgi:hypothetical protein
MRYVKPVDVRSALATMESTAGFTERPLAGVGPDTDPGESPPHAAERTATERVVTSTRGIILITSPEVSAASVASITLRNTRMRVFAT